MLSEDRNVVTLVADGNAEGEVEGEAEGEAEGRQASGGRQT